MEQKRKYSKRYCIAYGCLNNNKTIPDLSLFCLPKEPQRRREWLISIGRKDFLDKEDLKNKSYEVCSAHFDDSAMKIIKQLKAHAVPTKNLAKQTDNGTYITTSEKSTNVTSQNLDIFSDIRQQESTYISIGTQTEIITTSEKTTEISISLTVKKSQKRTFLKDLSISEHKCRRLDPELQKVKKEFETKNTAALLDPEDDINPRFKKIIIDWQNKLQKFDDRHFDAESEAFATNLYYSSPQAYRCLQTVLKLPDKFKNPSKLDDWVLKSLSMEINLLPQKAKYCSICIDEMVLKRNLYYDNETDKVVAFHNINGKISPDIASNGYVIMLQGIYCNWKQPIAFAFLASTEHYVKLDTWINQVIKNVFDAGIVIKAIISNQGSNFDKYAKEIKKVTVDSPFFFVDEQKIYYTYDVPHLLECLRDNLLLNDFYLNGKVISWNHVKTLYEDQKQKNLKLIPKITDSHMEPENYPKVQVISAAQIFSSTVYGALETYINFGIIPEEARSTSKFIKTMDDIFDVLNSNKVQATKKLQTVFRMSEEQKKVLEDGRNIFRKIKCINRVTGKENTKQIQTFVNFQITIESIFQLFQDLNNEGFQYLMTRRLNQDSLENFFGFISE